jgi:hypothetical protein
MFRKFLFIAAVMLMLIVPASAWSFSCVGPDMSTPLNDNATVYVGDTIRCWPDDTDMAVYEASSLHAQDKTNLLFSSPFTGTFVNYTIPSRTGYLWFRTLDAAHDAYFADKFYYYAYYKTPPADVVFSVSETGNFTKKLSGAIVTVSNGQSNTTTADGTALIRVYPTSSAYTYGVTKSGYVNLAGVALAGYGEAGGIVYTNMDPAVGSSKMVNLVAMQGGTDNFINGFTANVKDGSDNHWTNGTYPGGVAEIWTNKSTTLTGYVSATGYDSVTQTFTTDNTDWAEDWVILMYPPTAANATVSNLRINVADYSTKLPLKGVNALLTSTGELGLTSTSGVASFTVPNGTSQQVIFSKSGYKPVTQSFTITTLISEWNIEMVEQTVTTVPPTPVHTYPNGSVIPDTPTVTPSLTGAALQAYNQAQDQAMMQQLRDAGPGIIGLCVVVILMRLIKMI